MTQSRPSGEDYAYADSDEDTEEESDEDVQDAEAEDDTERTRAIMEDFADELGDEKDEYLFSDIMKTGGLPCCAVVLAGCL